MSSITRSILYDTIITHTHTILYTGPLEVYLPYKCSQNEAGRNLVQFLQTRRVESNTLMVGCMNQVHSYYDTHHNILSLSGT